MHALFLALITESDSDEVLQHPNAGKAPPDSSASGLQQGAELTRGQVWFIPADTAVEISVPASAILPLVMWSAACNSMIFAQHIAPEEEAVPSRLREQVLTFA